VRVLVVNAGSSSLKLRLLGTGDELLDEADVPAPRAEVDDAAVASWLERAGEVDAVGHRVVHGGERFREPTRIDAAVVEALRGLTALAPLHQPKSLAALEAVERALPGTPAVACFDTAFHATLPPAAATYAVPAAWRERWGVRRYGFHGLAVQSVAEQVEAERLVVCHLGGGCSVTAVRDGRSIDTSMGFSPLEGVPMATRSGSVDPGALIYLLREHGLGVDELDQALEYDSGLEALGGLDDPLGFGVYTYRVAAAAAQMAAALRGLDVLAFSGGVGENRADVREAVAERLAFLGRFTVEAVPAREELVIAANVRGLLAL
jgi:acetate kinase